MAIADGLVNVLICGNLFPIDLYSKLVDVEYDDKVANRLTCLKSHCFRMAKRNLVDAFGTNAMTGKAELSARAMATEEGQSISQVRRMELLT